MLSCSFNGLLIGVVLQFQSLHGNLYDQVLPFYKSYNPNRKMGRSALFLLTTYSCVAWGGEGDKYERVRAKKCDAAD